MSFSSLGLASHSLAACRALAAAALVWLIVLSAPAGAENAPGDLDPSFGSGGKFTLAVGAGASGIAATVVQADDKIVVAGFANESASPPLNSDFLVARLNKDGTLDTSFNPTGAQPGVITTPIAAGTGNDSANAVALGPNGTIYAAGLSQGGDSGDFAVVRYTSGGALDTSFSADGIQTFSRSTLDYATGIAVQPGDGKPIVIGFAAGKDFQVIRLEPTTGSFDTTFNPLGPTPGVQEVSFGAADADQPLAIALQGDGKAVVVGAADSGTPNADIAIARLNTDGTLDTAGFGSGTGKVQTVLPNAEFGSSLAFQGAKIVVAGASLTTSAPFAKDSIVARYLPDGSPDNSFSGDGVQITPFMASDGTRNANAQSVLIQANKIVTVGPAATCGGAGCTDFGAARYNDDGELDPTFGSGGKRTFGIGSENDFAAGGALLVHSLLLVGICDFGGLTRGCAAEVVTDASTSPPPPAEADLIATKRVRDALTGHLLPVAKPTVRVGQLLRYELTLTNTSLNVAHAVQLADATSIFAVKAQRTSYPVPVPSTPNCSLRKVDRHRDALVCDLGDLGPGETKDISYELTPTRDGELNNRVWARDNGLPRGPSGLSVLGLEEKAGTLAKVIPSDAPLFDEESATGVDAQGHGSLSAACQRALCDVLLGVAQSDISVPRVLRRDRATVGGARKPPNILGTVRGRIRGHKRGNLKLRLNRKGIRRLKRAGRLLVVLDGTVRSGKRHAHVRVAHILKLKP